MEIGHLEDGSIILTQKKHIEDLLHEHGMKNCAPASTRMTPFPLTKALEGYKCNKDLLAAYQSLLGR